MELPPLIFTDGFWNSYCPESWLRKKQVRMRLNTNDFYESEHTGLQIAISAPGIKATILKTRGSGQFRETKDYAHKSERGEMLAPQDIEQYPYSSDTFLQASADVKNFIRTIPSVKVAKSLLADYKRREKQNENGFISFQDFGKWYAAQEKVCVYCGLTEQESQLLATTILKSKRFPQDGVPGRGTARAMHLEVDRKDPRGLYNRENCVLACYFCNNDKSDIFSDAQYRAFSVNRVGFLRDLIRKHQDDHR